MMAHPMKPIKWKFDWDTRKRKWIPLTSFPIAASDIEQYHRLVYEISIACYQLGKLDLDDLPTGITLYAGDWIDRDYYFRVEQMRCNYMDLVVTEEETE